MVGAPCSHLWGRSAEAGAGAMLVACRLADLSALEGHYAEVSVSAQFGGACGGGSFLLGVGERGRPPLPSQTRATLTASSSLAAKSRRLAGNRRLGDEGDSTSFGASASARDAPRGGRCHAAFVLPHLTEFRQRPVVLTHCRAASGDSRSPRRVERPAPGPPRPTCSRICAGRSIFSPSRMNSLA